MGDAADDAILWAENEGAFEEMEDDGGYGYCPHVEDYGYCMGSRCQPLEDTSDEEDTSDVEIDSPYGFFQNTIDKVQLRPPSKPTVDMIAKVFDVPAEFIGTASDHASAPALDINIQTSRHMPPGTGYVFSADPSRPEQGVILMLDEASEVIRQRDKTRIDWEAIRAQFPSYAAWAAKYVPQKINNPKEKYTMDMSGIAKMRSDLEGMLAKFTSMVAIVERFGGEPGEGSVIKFEHSFESGEDAKVYDYVAVRKFGKWYVSGRPFAGRAVKWSELLEFIGEGRAWICREYEEVPVPGAAPKSDADKAAAVADLLANSGGRDTAEVAAEVVALLESK